MTENFDMGLPEELASWILSLTAEERTPTFAKLIKTELFEAGRGREAQELLFAGNVGTRIVKCLHFPYDVLGDFGPMLLLSANPEVVLGVVSDELISDKIVDMLLGLCSPTDLSYNQVEQYKDPDLLVTEWQNYLKSLAETLYAMTPPEPDNWETLLN